MRNQQSINLFSEIISALLILLFVYTAISKLLDFSNFKAVLVKSPLIGSFAGIISIVLPLIELFISALLIIPQSKIKGLFLSFLVMCVFTIYLGLMILFSAELPCSCGGVIGSFSWSQHLIFNVIVTILALIAWSLAKKNNNLFIAINRGNRKPV